MAIEYLGAGSSTTKLLLHLNGNSTDSSGNGNNGTDTNITYSQANGKFGQGAGFNGSSSRIKKVTPTGFPSGAGARTLSLWLNKTSTANSVVFGYGENAQNSRTYGFYIDNLRIWFWFFNDDVNTGIDIALNTWNNIALTYDGTTVKLYLNGEYKAATTKTLNTVTTEYIIGAYAYATVNANHFQGAMDEILLDNFCWTASEVKKYYTYAKGRFGII